MPGRRLCSVSVRLQLAYWRRSGSACSPSSIGAPTLKPQADEDPTPIERATALLAISTPKARMASLPTAARSSQKVAKNVFQHQRRCVSDVAITRTGKPIIRVQGGRCVCLVALVGFSDVEILTTCFTGHLAEVCDSTDLTTTGYLTETRSHRDGIWRNRCPRSIHCQQTRFALRVHVEYVAEFLQSGQQGKDAPSSCLSGRSSTSAI